MFTAPDELRAKLGVLSATQLVNEAARLRPRPGGDVALHGVKTTAVILARRVHALDAELAVLGTLRIDESLVATNEGAAWSNAKNERSRRTIPIEDDTMRGLAKR